MVASLFEAHSLFPTGPLFAALIVLAFFGWSDVKNFLWWVIALNILVKERSTNLSKPVSAELPAESTTMPVRA